MPRIRSIKPEFATSLAIAGLSIEARLHFVMLWTQADDEGRGIDEPRLLKAALWPLDDAMTTEKVDGLQAELERNGRIVRYEVAGRRYFEVANFAEHQHPQKKKVSGLPAPDDADTVPVRDTSDTETEPLSSVVVGESRVEVEVGEIEPAQAPDETRAIFDAWIEVTGRTGRTVLDPKRRGCIKRALKSHGYDTCLDAIRGWQNSSYHRGGNSEGKVYDELTLILRDASKIEGFARLWREPPAPQGRRRGEHEAALSSASREFLAAEQQELTSGVA